MGTSIVRFDTTDTICFSDPRIERGKRIVMAKGNSSRSSVGTTSGHAAPARGKFSPSCLGGWLSEATFTGGADVHLLNYPCDRRQAPFYGGKIVDVIIQHTSHMVTQHPVECTLLCFVSVALTLAIRLFLRSLLS